jgi:hypothetical protein
MPRKKWYICKSMIVATQSEVRNVEFIQSQLALGYMFILLAGAEAKGQYVQFDLPIRCSQYRDQISGLVCGVVSSMWLIDPSGLLAFIGQYRRYRLGRFYVGERQR